MGELHGKELIQSDADGRDGQAQPAGQTDGVLHPLLVPGGVVVGHQGHHALADADAHVQREALHLQHDSHGGQGQIVVGDHQLIDDDIVQIEQERGDSRGDAHAKDGHNAVPAGQAHSGREGDHRAPTHPHQHAHKEEEGDAVGKTGGQSGTQYLVTVRQQYEHEQRV